MNFLLNEIELHIDDSLVEQAEKLLEANAISQLIETEKHLWIATVEDDFSYEIEIQITPSKIKAYTCDCNAFAHKEVCTHITAGLLKLRKQQQRNEKKKKQPKKIKKPKKLTTNSILKNINADDLIAFVRSYARDNRNFAIALKARFASAVNLEDSEEKYIQLMDTAINNAQTQASKISARASAVLHRFTTSLFEQAEDAIIEKNYAEGIFILKAIVLKIMPLLKWMEGSKKDMILLINTCLNSFKSLIDADIAPQLRTLIWNFAFDQSRKSFYRNNKLEDSIYDLLLAYANTSEKNQQIIAAIDDDLKSKTATENLNLLLIKMSLLEKEKRMEEFQLLIKENLSNPNLLLVAVQKSLKSQQLSYAKHLAKHGASISTEQEHLYRFKVSLLEIAKLQKKQSDIIKYANECFLLGFELEYLLLLKQEVKDWKSTKEILISQIQTLPFSLAKRDVLAAIFELEKDYPALLNYVSSTRSVDLLNKYSTILLDFDNEKTSVAYINILSEYLQNHIGRQAAVKVRTMLERLQINKEHKLVEKLLLHFRKEFSERHSLMEELNELVPA